MLRRMLAVMAVVMMMTLSGCYSIIAGVGVVNLSDDTGSSATSSAVNSGSSYAVSNKTAYPRGRDAFYVDETKCVKAEIEEFHLMAMRSTTFMYYYTAKSTHKSSNESGYYCLATYDYNDTASYKVLTDGFYNKEKGNASIVYDVDINGTGIACIGNTFVCIEEMSFEKSFVLSSAQYSSIWSDVGGEFMCYDIAVANYYGGLFRAAYTRVPNASDEKFKTVVYRIFNDGENITMDRVNGDMDINSVNTCDSYEDSRGYISVAFLNSEGNKNNVFKFYEDKGDDDNKGLYAKDTVSIGKRNRDENLLGFTLEKLSGADYIMLLYEDRVELRWIKYKKKRKSAFKKEARPNSAELVATIALDNGMNYISFDNTPSIVPLSTSTIYTCSLTNGFRRFQQGETKTEMGGAYYAAYSTDGEYCTLVGFDTNKLSTTAVTSRDGVALNSETSEREVTGQDLPYAKVYSVHLSPNSFPINAGTIVVAQPAETSGTESSG